MEQPPPPTESSQSSRTLVMDKHANYQLRALSRNALSYQKRQKFANICCIALCPLLMVAIAGILGIVVTNLVNDSLKVTESVYCANSTGTVSGSSIPHARLRNVSLVSSPPFIMPDLTNIQSAMASDSSYYTPSCINWFEHDFPQRAPYELYKSSGPVPRRDTTFKPDSIAGMYNDQGYMTIGSSTGVTSQNYPWAIVYDASGVDSGSKEKQPLITNIFDVMSKLNSTQGQSGFLGKLDTNLYAAASYDKATMSPKLNGFQPVPYFEKPSVKSPEDIDNILFDHIRSTVERIQILANQSESMLSDAPNEAYKILSNMPWGALLFNKMNSASKQWDYTMQIGSNKRISKVGYMAPEELRRIAFQAMLGNAMARTAGNGNNDVTITHGLRMFPVLVRTEMNLPIATLTGRILFPFGISFLLPIFVLTLVREKEERLFIMMRMNGLKSRYYYIVYFLQFFIMQIVASIVFVLTGLGFSMSLFTQTNPGVYIILLIVWAIVQVFLSFFLSCFFSKSRTALITIFVIVLASVMGNTVVEQLVPGRISPAYFIWPPFAFYRALSIVNLASTSIANKSPYRMSNLTGDDQVLQAILFMIGEIIVLGLLTSYLNLIMRSEYGVQKPWYFIFTEPFRWIRKKMSNSTVTKHIESGDGDDNGRAVYEEEEEEEEDTEYMKEDDDVRAERDRVLKNEYSQLAPVVVKHMRKVYPNGKVAVKDITMAIEPNQVFGLLGPNGAGKTSLIHILTGLYAPTSGQAWLNGLNIATEMQDIYRTIGICPQHDILWDDLTVEEHLYFYARLKGVSPKDEDAAVTQAIEYVILQQFRHRLSKGLSGGEKRRLSIAISLIGDPGVVFLDEPTTGLDPEVKRIIWDIIDHAKQGRSIILTTHSMEEAEVLCRRVGIMTHGLLRCIGPIFHLKEVYGKGFRLSLAGSPHRLADACRHVEQLLPENWQLIDNFSNQVSYEFKPAPTTLSNLFASLEANKSNLGIDDWGISQTSLEEVFLRIVHGKLYLIMFIIYRS
ncbi:hypothetical protein BDF22DRAFT_692827 [Syncephalis plumigaleata]|nr:hypothetical protein BDF22DRAFT_692827 [Syncephalis plumigaleata]